jgi:hypothetical protein
LKKAQKVVVHLPNPVARRYGISLGLAADNVLKYVEECANRADSIIHHVEIVSYSEKYYYGVGTGFGQTGVIHG